ncbi:hypothetical protein SK128_022183, partial [Halocaridina rubra]
EKKKIVDKYDQYYRIIGVDEKTSRKQIKLTHWILTHTSANPGQDKLKRVNIAYTNIMDPDKVLHYRNAVASVNKSRNELAAKLQLEWQRELEQSDLRLREA